MAQLFLTGVAGDMETFTLFIDNFGTLAVQLIDDTGNSLFVAGNGGGGDDDSVAGGDIHLFMGGKGHAV